MAQNSESQHENPKDEPGKRGGYFGTTECGWVGEEGTGKNESGELSTADVVEDKLNR
jgi:hypothetical protein